MTARTRAGATRDRNTRRFASSRSRSTPTQAGRSPASTASGVGAADERDRAGAAEVDSVGSDITVAAIEILERGGLAEEDELDRPGLAVAVLGDDQLGHAAHRLVFLVVHLVAIDE